LEKLVGQKSVVGALEVVVDSKPWKMTIFDADVLT